ncbi:hypothetical protein MCOR33_008536 [Pyricularia grisea]|uniref:Cation-transporting P-type ATPase N-terminal domain-containing protein n=1 Tax=Pyricularia grisea TaxID=148305 RepID=A0ABQ8NB61_PYRGI|nr:hypothetical protein MCOR33_008536 [Pyricularia grisea]
MPDEEKAAEELSKPGVDADLHITFHGVDADDERQRRGPGVGRSTSRASSRSSRRRLPQTSPYAGIPIQYRTLSIHESESRRVEAAAAEVGGDKSEKGISKQDQDYFAALNYHQLSTETICQQLNVSQDAGLSSTAAKTRIERDGPNVMPHPKTNYFKKILMYLFGGFCSVLWVGVIVFFICWQPLSDPPSPTNLALAILILIVIFLQAGFSAFQDWSTSNTMKSIQNLLPSETLVIRDGQEMRLPASELVAGDVVRISMGNKVPADMRLVSTSGDIRFDRAMLTGESDEVEGAVDATDENFLETRNIALMGTLVVNGSGTGVVVLTGTRSVMGRIAQAMSNVSEKETLIQREIVRFVKIIVCFTIALASLIAIAWGAWLRKDHPGFMSVVAMLNNVMGCVVAFIPEGMPIAVSLTLMIVARRMKASNILPKGLATVETLGCVNVVCSDKTGTLTQNKMTVSSVAFVDSESVPDDIFESNQEERPMAHALKLHEAAVLCNDATFEPTTTHLPVDERAVRGNATDAAVLRFAAQGERVSPVRPRKPDFKVPFNSKNKWMLTMFGDGKSTPGQQYTVFVKGAPDVLLPHCTNYWSAQGGEVRPLDGEARATLKGFQDKMSRRAERVILLCETTFTLKNTPGTNAFSDEVASEAIKTGLTVIALLGIIDPPRPETAHTISECRRAGIRFFMVTGDYGLTASAIARNIGLFRGSGEPDTVRKVQSRATPSADEMRQMRIQSEGGNGEVRSLLVEGPEIATLSTDDWDVVCEYQDVVFARTTPEQKLRIVTELQARHNVVAVTGDGVNDAPAMRKADVGVAVISGSDVAIEAADLVLMDKFDSIIDAIRLGRLVFQNLQKVISYLLPAGSYSEIAPVILNVFFGTPLPLSAFLMIIICVFTDLFLCLSLIMEKAEFDLLAIPPRDHRRDHLINARIYGQAYLFTGTMETTIAHSMFFLYMWRYAGMPVHELFFLYEGFGEGYRGYTQDQLNGFVATGQSVYFVTLVMLQWGNILAVRNRRMSIVQADPFTKQRRNPWLPLSMVLSLAIAVFVTQTPGIQNLFQTATVPIEFWFIPIPLALAILLADEGRKLLVRLFPKGPIARVAW